MPEFQLRIGDSAVSLAIDGAVRTDVLREKQFPPIADVPAALKEAFEHPIGASPLTELIDPEDEVTIIISDVTRAWMHQDLITELTIRYLHEKIGLPFEQIVVLIALGTHRPQTAAEMVRIASQYAVDHVRLVNHDGRAPSLPLVGVTSRGTPVRVNPLVLNRKIILIGGTVNHLLAGYGGGRKSILPGVSGWDTIQKNHSHALDPVYPRSNAAVGLGKLQGNPVHEDMMEATGMINPCFSINLVVNGGGEYLGILCGDWQKAWLESCRLVDQVFGVEIPDSYDMVIASAGGYPKDINLYQGSKTLINAMQAVKPGGEVVFLAECREGGGPAEFFDWIAPQQEGRLDSALREGFTIAGYIFYAICEMAGKAHISMLTSLNPAQAKAMNISAFSSLDSLLSSLDFSGKRVLVLPNGGGVVPRVQPKNNSWA